LIPRSFLFWTARGLSAWRALVDELRKSGDDYVALGLMLDAIDSTERFLALRGVRTAFTRKFHLEAIG
jgi:hypothetical protein